MGTTSLSSLFLIFFLVGNNFIIYLDVLGLCCGAQASLAVEQGL